jgi:hypothetical protein
MAERGGGEEIRDDDPTVVPAAVGPSVPAR